MTHRTFTILVLIAAAAAGCHAAEPSSSSTAAADPIPPKEKKCPHCSDETSLQALVESVTPWHKPDERKEIKALDVKSTDQDGKDINLKDLLGQPIAISFFYSRCSNANKCPLAVQTMGKLAEDVKNAGLGEKVRLLMISYDPEYDTPAMMKKFGENLGVTFDARTQMLRIDPDRKKQLFDEMGLSVNFNVSGVSLHGVELLLLDKKGRLARNYHTLIWKNESVIDDLKQLANEEK